MPVRFRCQRAPTRASRTTIKVATPGPNHKTAAKTKTSETERRALTVGILRVSEPVSSVSAASTTQPLPGGESDMAAAECARATNPEAMTMLTYVLAVDDSREMSGIPPSGAGGPFIGLLAPDNYGSHNFSPIKLSC